MDGGDDETTNTITANNDEESYSCIVLKPLQSIWECDFMKKNYNNT